MENEYSSLLRLFREQGVKYVVVGGYAVIAHGFPRATGNLDLLVNPTPANAHRAVLALTRLGYTNGEFEEADFTQTPNFLSLAPADGWVNLMTQIPGVSFADCVAESLRLPFAGEVVPYIGLAALRATKRATGRPQNLRDLDNLPDVP